MYKCYLAIFLLINPCIVFAHTTTDLSFGLKEGFAHPFTGLDHMLAMISVGLLAYQKQKWHQFLLPITFITCMAIGGIIGFKGYPCSFSELGITLSIFCLGMLCVKPKIPGFALYLLIAAFAFCHGHAHGIEIPATSNFITFASGFLLATALLHGGGFLLGYSFAKVPLSFLGIKKR